MLDGYPVELTTKDTAHLKCTKKNGRLIKFALNSKTSMSKEKFLLNKVNKLESLRHLIEYFNTSFQPATCNGWKEFSKIKPTKTVNPKRDKKDNKKEARGNDKKALEEPIEPNVNEFIAAVYERKVYVGNIHKIGENEAYIHFLAHNGTLTRNRKFREPKVMDDV